MWLMSFDLRKTIRSS